MNTKRIVLNGLVAGLVMNVIDFVNNAVIFGNAWNEAYKSLGFTQENPAIPAFWITFDFVAGILMAFLYAAMRPRLGAGARTALISGGIVWLLVHLTLASHLVDGVFPAYLLLGTGALELISELVGGLVVGRLHVEKAETATGPAPSAVAG